MADMEPETATKQPQTKKFSKPHRGSKQTGRGIPLGRADMVHDSYEIDEGDPCYQAPEPEAAVPESRYSRDAKLAKELGVELEYDPALAKVAKGTSPTNGSGTAAGLDIKDYKKKIELLIDEYFSNESLDDLAESVRELGLPLVRYELVKRSITKSMDRTDRERALVSDMLSNFYHAVMAPDQIARGFERVLQLLPDLVLDIPDAKRMVAKFLARAINDEILPPKYLQESTIDELAPDVIADAKTLLSLRHHGSIVEHVWRSGQLETVPKLKQDVKLLVQEYFMSGDKEEALRCIRELDVPHFYHEVVKCALIEGIEASSEEALDKAMELIKYLVQNSAVGGEQVKMGFQRVRDRLGDLTLDTPTAPAKFERLRVAAVAQDVLGEADVAATGAKE